MILSKQKCCLLFTGVSTESKTYLCTSDKASFLATRSMTRINVGLDLSYVILSLLPWKTYVQFECMVYKQIMGISLGTNCASLIAELFIFCYERYFISSLLKSIPYDFIDMLNDTSR